jgi:ABC-type cobalamin/Fe3+-siderophores transport system ATPase subunit
MTALLAAEGIHFAYGNRSVLRGVSFDVHLGEIVALAGPNGAGKTTLVKLLAGVLVPSLGRVHAFVDRPRAIAYLAQSEELPQDWSVREVVELGRIPHAGLWRDMTARDDRSVRFAMECTEVLSLSEPPRGCVVRRRTAARRCGADSRAGTEGPFAR